MTTLAQRNKSGWNPAQLGRDVVLWLEADRGITLGAGTDVAQWSDQSGLGNHMAQATVAQRPVYVTPGGSSTQYLDSSTAATCLMTITVGTAVNAITNGWTQIYVARHASAIVVQKPLFVNPAAAPPDCSQNTVRWRDDGTQRFQHIAGGITGGTAIINTSPTLQDTWYMIAIVMNPNTGVRRFYINGTANVSTVGHTANMGHELGRGTLFRDGATQGSDIHLKFCLHVQRRMEPDEIMDALSYLQRHMI